MAIYTELSQEEIADFLSAYDLPPLLKAEGIRAGVENTNYQLVLKDGRKLILTLFEKRVNETDLPFFTGLMEHLAEKVIPVPKPLHGSDGNIIQRVKNRPAVIVTFLEGKEAAGIKARHLAELGACAARMHMAGSDYKPWRANDLSLEGWKKIFAKISPRLDEISAGLAEELDGEIRTLEEAWPAGLPRGVIHADLFPDNVFFNADERIAGIIDFYFACDDFLAYELAVCINAWCFEKDGRFNIAKSKALLENYHALRPLAGEELAALPVLARGAALRFLFTRAHDWLFRSAGALVTPKDPMEYLRKLRFHQSVIHHREYGL